MVPTSRVLEILSTRALAFNIERCATSFHTWIPQARSLKQWDVGQLTYQMLSSSFAMHD